MATLAVMKTRIADDLARSDLTSQIADAITSAIARAESERFWFNESRSITFNTVASQVAYTSSDNARIPYLVRVDAMYLTQTSSIYPLDRFEPDDFEIVSGGTSQSGRPVAYTYTESTIRLWPTPDAVYAMRVHAHYKLAAFAADSESNAWTTEAEEYIRCLAKERLYLHVLKDAEGAAAMQAIVPSVLDALRAETSARTGLGKIVPVDF